MGGRCGVPDYDGDGIPDLEEPKKCLDTSPGDAINDEGCSCEQGADEVYIDNNGEQVLKSCKDLEKQNEPCNDGSKGHCCNSIKDKDELLADCGGKDCSSCEGVCTKIIDGGDLDILLVPVAYTSSTDLSVINNIDEWEARADLEASKITSTPPFDSGQVSVWRLDLFNFDKNFQERIYNNDLGGYDDENIRFFKQREYSNMCPGIDLVTVLPSNYERSFAILNSGFNIVYNDDSELNVITHETGHSFCGLDDEYLEDSGLFQQFYQSIMQWTHINCDNAPQLWRYGDGTEELKCKWWREYPDAGCIKGCNYNDNWYRPINDFEDSMMQSNYQIGSADYGKGTWNQVSYERCKELVENYES